MVGIGKSIFVFILIIVLFSFSCKRKDNIIHDKTKYQDTIKMVYEKINDTAFINKYIGYTVKARYERGFDRVTIWKPDLTETCVRKFKPCCEDDLEYVVTPNPIEQFYYEFVGFNNKGKEKILQEAFIILKDLNDHKLVGFESIQKNSFIKLYTKYKVLDSLGNVNSITFLYRCNEDSTLARKYYLDIYSPIDTIAKNWYVYFSPFYGKYSQLH